jgi:TorA maturation chaperone TorD
MNAKSASGSTGATERCFAEAVAGDLLLLADLHDREPTAEVVAAVQAGPVQEQLGMVLKNDPGLAALEAMWLAADALPRPITAAALDELAAGFADVYLRHTYRAAPTESVWLTDDGLERQEPMLQVRAFYRRHNVRVTDWANRPDDHLVLQLRFIAHLMRPGGDAGPDFKAAAQFMDEHILRWIRSQAVRLVQARAPDWYAALSLLTASYLDEVRDYLETITGMARTAPEAKTGKKEPGRDDVERPYVPGVAPSW